MSHPMMSKGRHLPLLGQNRHGTVYQLDESSCLQLFATPRQCRREAENLDRGKSSDFFPKLYERGENYVIREFIPGQSLASRLEGGIPLPPEEADQLVGLLKDLEALQFKRLDLRLAQVYRTPTGRLKLIDTATLALKSQPFPYRLLEDLRAANSLESFSAALKSLRPQWAAEWLKDR